MTIADTGYQLLKEETSLQHTIGVNKLNEITGTNSSQRMIGEGKVN